MIRVSVLAALLQRLCTGPGSLDSFPSYSRGRPHLRADLTRRAMAVALHEPLRVVALDERPDLPLGMGEIGEAVQPQALRTLSPRATSFRTAPNAYRTPW